MGCEVLTSSLEVRVGGSAPEPEGGRLGAPPECRLSLVLIHMYFLASACWSGLLVDAYGETQLSLVKSQLKQEGWYSLRHLSGTWD